MSSNEYIQKIEDKNLLHGGIAPMVIVRISRAKELPRLEDIEDLEIVKVLESGRKLRKSARIIDVTFLRNIPKKLIYLGNSTKGLEEIYSVDVEDIAYNYASWNTFEYHVVTDYIVFNIQKHPNVFVVPKGLDKKVMEEMMRMQNTENEHK